MDNPGSDAPDLIEDLLSEETWLAGPTPHGAADPDPAAAQRVRERLRHVQGELDRCAELLRGRRPAGPAHPAHPAGPARVARRQPTQ